MTLETISGLSQGFRRLLLRDYAAGRSLCRHFLQSLEVLLLVHAPQD
jgi:hypothetical protein